jgi:ABC-type Mn2+/Zn2+ transport system permease subunit
MQKIVNGIFQSPAARALILLVLIIPVSVLLGTTTVRRGFLYYTGILAPATVAAIAAGLWTWSWRWFWLVLGASIVLTMLIQALFYLL